jgi:phosphatidylglycerol---prolipoprotein diacylglyceryl transferase
MNILASINWAVSPEIFSLGPISVRWYGLLFALGFIVGYQIMLWIFNKEAKSVKDLETLTFYMIISTVVGARIGHCLFYEPMEYLANPLEILKVWHGGLASHGAAIGIIFALWIFSYKRKENIGFLWILDRIVITIALAGCFIRLGNFFNHEIVGAPANIPWAVLFTLDRSHELVPRHPTQLYEAFSYLIIFFILFFRYKKLNMKLADGQLFGLFLALVFGARFIIEFFKENQVEFEGLLQKFTYNTIGLHLNMGQLLSVPFVALGLYFIFKSLLAGKKQ